MPSSYPESAYEPVESIPDGVKWKPVSGTPNKKYVKLVSTPGAMFRLERCRETGQARYFRLKDTGPEMSSKEKLDGEPKRKEQVRYKVGAHCWFIEDNHWFLVEVVDRQGFTAGTKEARIVLKPVNPLDADKQRPWAHGELLELVANQRNMARLRPLKDRYR